MVPVVVSKLYHDSGLVKIQIAEPQSRLSDLVNLEWGLRIYIYNTFSGDTDAAGQGNIL